MPELARASGSLRIIGDALDPDEITRLLGVPPTGCARKGDTRHSASGRAIIARSGSWLLKADALGDLNTQITMLLTKIPADPATWLELSYRYQCDVFCGVFMQESNEGIEL